MAHVKNSSFYCETIPNIVIKWYDFGERVFPTHTDNIVKI